MTSAPVETQAWSRQRWWVAIALVLALQVALVFVLENRATPVPVKTIATPVIHWRENVSFAPLAVSDPTLFVLPHREGFSGAAWLDKIPTNDFSPAEWSAPPLWLTNSASTLGANFKDFMAANAAPSFQTLATIAPPRLAPPLFAVETPTTQSELRLGGALGQRRLLSLPALPAWTNTDLVGGSVVQLLVDEQGRTLSAALLPPGSGLQAADDYALELGNAAEFEPVAGGPGSEINAASQPTVGTMTFAWQTLPLPATNAPAETP